ncbi:hypothetical protein GFY24_17885 [Nocardia sp. SYP-A9097]|nr:hypothetical protein [Nocardia sp. SYP-A9097]
MGHRIHGTETPGLKPRKDKRYKDKRLKDKSRQDKKSEEQDQKKQDEKKQDKNPTLDLDMRSPGNERGVVRRVAP